MSIVVNRHAMQREVSISILLAQSTPYRLIERILNLNGNLVLRAPVLIHVAVIRTVVVLIFLVAHRACLSFLVLSCSVSASSTVAGISDYSSTYSTTIAAYQYAVGRHHPTCLGTPPRSINDFSSLSVSLCFFCLRAMLQHLLFCLSMHKRKQQTTIQQASEYIITVYSRL